MPFEIDRILTFLRLSSTIYYVLHWMACSVDIQLMTLSCCFRNNFLRVWVLRVCQQSEKHLDKILNVDEFVRRIFSVIHSNDPVSSAVGM